MRRGRLPLTALRSFEVAGRLCSFTQAAQELLISQAAVSRQVRELEAMLGQELFERGHRSVRLTSAGERLLRVLTASFDDISACLDELRRHEARPTVPISAEPSFAACWLVPHLPAFQQQHPGIDVSIDADPRLIEFRSHQASVAIRHSAAATSWPRVESRHLADVRITPVISPQLLEGRAHCRRRATCSAMCFSMRSGATSGGGGLRRSEYPPPGSKGVPSMPMAGWSCRLRCAARALRSPTSSS